MIISLIKGKILSKPTWLYLKNELPLLLNHERTVINYIHLESWVQFH